MILPPAMAEKVAILKVHRSSNGTVLGCCLWIPGSFIEPHVQPGKEEIEISFENDRIEIVKATGGSGLQHEEHQNAGSTHGTLPPLRT